MSETFEYNGKIYRRYPNSKRRSDRVYFKRSITGGTVWLHRQIWIDAHGEIPAGHHIHHKDENPDNNTLENLECLSAAEHLGENHVWDEERRTRQAKHLDKIRPLTKAWHSSAEGLAKHREIGGLAYKNYVPTDKCCEQCGCVFTPKKLGDADKFCSNKCKSAWRRATGVDDVERKCECCGATFVCNKYRKQKVCSRSCANRHRSRKG